MRRLLLGDDFRIRNPFQCMMGSALCVIGFVVPMTSLFWDAIMAGDSMGAVELMALMGNTLLVASIAAFCCLIAAVWLSYAARRTDHPLVRTGIRIRVAVAVTTTIPIQVGAKVKVNSTIRARRCTHPRRPTS